MKYNKFLVLAMIAVLAVFVVGSVYAADATKEKIRGIEFNIPAGFEETGTPMHDNVSQSGSVKATTDMVFYKNDTQLFSIMVIEFNSPAEESLVSDEGQKTDINGVTGYMSQTEDGYYNFNFVRGNSTISILSTSEDLIKEIVVK